VLTYKSSSLLSGYHLSVCFILLCSEIPAVDSALEGWPFAPWCSVSLQHLVVAQLVNELLPSTAENVIDLDREACGDNILSFQKEESPYQFIF
jgi:uncharacterized membrane protein